VWAVFGRFNLARAQALVSPGAIVGITSVLLTNMLSQTCILLAMARDGLLPERFFGYVGGNHTSWKTTILTRCFIGVLSSLPHRTFAPLRKRAAGGHKKF
jgi:APA family basic amino acid/polyamine antiporter